MNVFLYEWATGGGLVEHPGALPASLVAEGAAMIGALAEDFRGVADCGVSALRDIRLDVPPLPGCQVDQIHSAAHLEETSAALTAAADYTLVIAPEFDQILGSTVARLRRHGCLLNASDEFIAATSDKGVCADLLAAAGAPTPEAVVVDADQERLPADFSYPAVLKPLDGAGSQHTLLVHGPQDEPEPYPWPRRLERYCAGRPASVALLCGPGGAVPLPPCWQRLSDDGRFTYRGGALIVEEPLALRARRLALHALAALPPASGYVGVDLVLGPAADGSDDVILEVNPRLTTSYIGLRAAVKTNLAEAMVQVTLGTPTQVEVTTPRVEFSADGQTWH